MMIRKLHRSITISPIKMQFFLGYTWLYYVVLVTRDPIFGDPIFSGHGVMAEARGYVSIVQLLLDALADPWPVAEQWGCYQPACWDLGFNQQIAVK